MTRLRTLRSLGLQSVARVMAYRLALKLRVHPALHLQAAMPQGPFFRAPAEIAPAAWLPSDWAHDGRLFGWKRVAIDGPAPDWFWNAFDDRRLADPARPWWTIADFDPAVGDIKTIWEWSRMDFLLANAARAAAGDDASLDRVDRWLADWVRANPPYLGPNWKCGQEASIRVLHVALALVLLRQAADMEPGLADFLRCHLERIAPTTGYARGQDNNHGTSEAAALFVGGALLDQHGIAGGRRIMRQGRDMLEERVDALVSADGGFSQYSTTYHRLFLDTLSTAELLRRTLDLSPFSPRLYDKLRAATEWLHALADPDGGDAPNFGANDGAQLLPLTDADSRDFRPSVQLAAALFCAARAYPAESGGDRLTDLLGVELPAAPMPPRGDRIFAENGIAALHRSRMAAFVRFPRYRFRPSQADALHVDIWVDGKPHLRDGGSYCYACPTEVGERFSSVAGHNTVQFDGQDQMPRLSRFLYGDWIADGPISAISSDGRETRFTAAYRLRSGPSHSRTVSLTDDGSIIRDEIDGFASEAVLRWRLPGQGWHLDGSTVRNGKASITVTATTAKLRMRLSAGVESKYYLKAEDCQLLVVELGEPCAIETSYMPGEES